MPRLDDGAGDEPRSAVPSTETPMPRLDSAAFLVAERVRSTTELDDGGSAGKDAEIAQPEEPTESDDVEASPPAVDEGEPAESIRAAPRSETGPSPFVPPSPALAQPLLPVQSAEPPADAAGPACDAVLGATGASPQYGLIGRTSGRTVALDLNQTHTISLFGVQGGGKSYTLGSVIEMACMPVAGVNRLPHPLAGVIFHYSATLDYQPEFTSMAAPNAVEAEVSRLRADYGASPQALDDLVILTPAAKVEARRAEYPASKSCPSRSPRRS